jgi:TRAP-type uncharacterized transport system substrate-binding protein
MLALRMTLEDLAALSRRDRLRVAVLLGALALTIVWATLQLMQPAPPRRIVLASGANFGLYHQFAVRYRDYLAKEGVAVEERMTQGAAENLALLRDPRSGVDVAFVQGGIVSSPAPDDVVMIASLYFEPLWVFYNGTRRPVRLTQLTQLAGKRIGAGAPGSGTRAMAARLLAANGIATDDGEGLAGTVLVDVGGEQALNELRAGTLDFVMLVGGADTPIIAGALRDESLRLMSLERAEAYSRRLPFITRATLPRGTIDLALDIPSDDIKMVATKAMLVSRRDLHPALAALLVDAAREIHAKQGIFENAGEFPNVTQVDLPVSADADRHLRYGPSFLHRYLPFWVATAVERTVLLLVPLAVVLVPLFNQLPNLLRWRIRKRIFRWYGELVLLERDIRTRGGELPLAQWQHSLDRIERAVGNIRTPVSFASEVYTLREHVALVRRTLAARAGSPAAPA